MLGPQIAGLPEVVDVTRLLAAEKAGKNRKRVLNLGRFSATCSKKYGKGSRDLYSSQL